MANPKPDTNLITNLKDMIGVNSTKRVKFMDKMIEVKKLTLAECMEIQTTAKGITEDTPEKGFDLLKQTIRMGVPAAAEFSDDDFSQFAMDDLQNLSNEVLRYAGMGNVGK
jgi:hypothetical protein